MIDSALDRNAPTRKPALRVLSRRPDFNGIDGNKLSQLDEADLNNKWGVMPTVVKQFLEVVADWNEIGFVLSDGMYFRPLTNGEIELETANF